MAAAAPSHQLNSPSLSPLPDTPATNSSTCCAATSHASPTCSCAAPSVTSSPTHVQGSPFKAAQQWDRAGSAQPNTGLHGDNDASREVSWSFATVSVPAVSSATSPPAGMQRPVLSTSAALHELAGWTGPGSCLSSSPAAAAGVHSAEQQCPAAVPRDAAAGPVELAAASPVPTAAGQAPAVRVMGPAMVRSNVTRLLDRMRPHGCPPMPRKRQGGFAAGSGGRRRAVDKAAMRQKEETPLHRLSADSDSDDDVGRDAATASESSGARVGKLVPPRPYGARPNNWPFRTLLGLKPLSRPPGSGPWVGPEKHRQRMRVDMLQPAPCSGSDSGTSPSGDGPQAAACNGSGASSGVAAVRCGSGAPNSKPRAWGVPGALRPDPDLQWSLLQWRRMCAESRGERPERLLKEEVLVQLAALRPTSALQLEALQGLSRPWVRRHGSEVLDVIRNHLHKQAVAGSRKGTAVAPPPPPLSPPEVCTATGAGVLPMEAEEGGVGAAPHGSGKAAPTTAAASEAPNGLAPLSSHASGSPTSADSGMPPQTGAVPVVATDANPETSASSGVSGTDGQPAQQQQAHAVGASGGGSGSSVNGSSTSGSGGSSAATREPLRRDRRAYTAGEEAWLVAQWQAGMSLQNLAAELQRTCSAVRRRLVQLGFSVSAAGASVYSGASTCSVGGASIAAQVRASLLEAMRVERQAGTAAGMPHPSAMFGGRQRPGGALGGLGAAASGRGTKRPLSSVVASLVGWSSAVGRLVPRRGAVLAYAATPSLEQCSAEQLRALLLEAKVPLPPTTAGAAAGAPAATDAAWAAAACGGGAAKKVAMAAAAEAGAASLPSTQQPPLEQLRRLAAEALPAWEVQRVLACQELQAGNMEAQAGAVLRIPPGASKASVKLAFRQLSLLLHPDKNRSEGSAAAFALLSACAARLLQ